MKSPETVLDLPIERQKELATLYGMNLEEWRERSRRVDAELAAHKITGYFDEETSKRFQAKMLSGTPT